jgi:signal transduction histidine kinase
MIKDHIPSSIIPRTFPGITLDEVEELIAFSEIREYPADIVICQEGALEDTFYLILDGEVRVSKMINNMETRLLKTLRLGDFFGEMALIQNVPRTATVKSVTPLVVLEINKEAFNRILKHSSSVSIALVREISRRLRENDTMAIEDLRMRARELADAYQKLAEEEVIRRDLLTNLAHLLRTPLMSAGGFLQLIQKGAVPSEQIPGTIDTISRNVQQISSLVNDILFIQEMDLILGKFQAVDMLALARAVLARYQDKAKEKGIKLNLFPGHSVPPVSGDAGHLERALIALVDNAVKFSPDGGRVAIRLGQRAGMVSVAVSDTGIGILPEYLPHIFDRFYHVDRSSVQLFEGLGLGLAITRQVIEQHKGKLEVTSTPGKGSTFNMRLRVWKDESGV